MLIEAAGGDVAGSTPDVLDLFFDVADAHPARVAVRAGPSSVSYAELKHHVLGFASALGVHESPRVLMALPRGVQAYACMLATGVAGGFYTPVNVGSPPEKLRRIACQLDPHVIVAPASLVNSLASAVPTAAILDPDACRHEPTSPVKYARHEIAYVMFTSGSTGAPKGVVVPRRALNHYVGWVHGSGTIGPDDVVSQFNSLASTSACWTSTARCVRVPRWCRSTAEATG